MTSTTLTPTDRISHVTGNVPDGIVRLFVPTGLTVSKVDLRNVAAKVAGTIHVGRTPAGRSGKLHGVTGHVFDFSPVRKGAATSTPAAPAEDPRTAVLAGLGLSPEQIAAVLAVSPAPAATPAAPKSAATPAKANAFRDKLVAKAKAREAQATKCGKCLGFGKVRPTARTRKDGTPVASYPFAFRTQHGADSAPTGIPCDECQAKTTTGKRGKAKASA